MDNFPELPKDLNDLLRTAKDDIAPPLGLDPEDADFLLKMLDSIHRGDQSVVIVRDKDTERLRYITLNVQKMEAAYMMAIVLSRIAKSK